MTLWPAAQDLAHDPQRVRPTLARWDEALDAVGEHDEADQVVVADRGQREHARQLGRELALALIGRAEVARRRDVHREHQRQLALLAELLDERPARARGDIPVDRAYLISGDVLADLVEVDAAATERRVVATGERVVDEHAGAQLELADLVHDRLHAVAVELDRRQWRDRALRQHGGGHGITT